MGSTQQHSTFEPNLSRPAEGAMDAAYTESKNFFIYALCVNNILIAKSFIENFIHHNELSEIEDELQFFEDADALIDCNVEFTGK